LLRAAFFGTPEFAVPTLEMLVAGGVEIVLVVTQPDRPAGRSGEPVPSAVGRAALARGAVVVTDRYVDSSLAYQGAGRLLSVEDIANLNDWATGGVRPDLTIILDLPPVDGLRRRERSADRLEAEPAEFHDRVRRAFLSLAEEAAPDRYLVLDASRPSADLSRTIQERVREMLPDPVPLTAEEITGSFPAIRD